MYTYVQTYIYVPSEPGWIAKRCPSYDVQADFPPFINDCVWRRKAKSWATTLTT